LQTIPCLEGRIARDASLKRELKIIKLDYISGYLL
jgi:hypothetical protein